MKATAFFFSILYVFLTVAMLFVRIASRAGPEWAPQFALGYLIVALIILWGAFFLLKPKQAKGAFTALAVVLALSSVSILATYNIDKYLTLQHR